MDRKYAQYLLRKTKQDYNKIAEEFSSKRRFMWRDLKPLLDYTTLGDRVLDLGCGNGRLFQALKDKHIEYLGVDNSEKLIEIARSKYAALGAKFQLADALNLSLLDNSFDKIYSIAVLHHIPSKEFRLQFLKEAKRVLKPNGLLILTVWKLVQKKSIKLALKYAVLKILGSSKLDFNDVLVPWAKTCQRYLHQFTKRRLKKLIEKANFKIEKIGTLLRPERKDTNIFVVARKV